MSKVNGRFISFLLLILVIAGAVFFTLKSRNAIDLTANKQQQPDGQQLARHYCSSCHQYPEPGLLDKHTWEHGILPEMAKQLKLESVFGKYGITTQSLISVPDFEAIVGWYRSAAPEKLPVIKSPSVTDWAIFTVEKPRSVNRSPGNDANTTLLEFNPIDKKLYSADMRNHLYRWGPGLKPSVVATLPSPAVGIDFYSGGPGQNRAVITCIGILNPNDLLKGSLVDIDLNKDKSANTTTIADSLPRPVQTISADFNNDGLTDYVTCGFGRNIGSLYLFTQQPNHSFKRSTIRVSPGSEQVVTGDFNNDGYPDLMCLFAQADEGIWMFINDKHGGFITKNVLHFPPIYGSSSFQLVDFNHDGKPDILYTCGDNSDLSPVLKPYHGIYIFTNQGNWTFKQTYFYHIDGSTKAIAADFDHDGDLDIATIAYFPDFKGNPGQGFTWLEQTGPNKFTAHQVPVNNDGRWLTMEVADLDADGYLDVILGNFSVPGRDLINQKGVEKTWDRFTPLIVLKNNAGKIAQTKAKPLNSK